MSNLEQLRAQLRQQLHNFKIDFSLGESGDYFHLKLNGGELWELNIRLTRDEINSLTDIHSADWDTRKTIRAGKSASSSVFWANDDNITTIMVGQDDETWDFAVCITTTLMEEIIKLIKRI